MKTNTPPIPPTPATGRRFFRSGTVWQAMFGFIWLILLASLTTAVRGANTFANAAPLASARHFHTTTLLPNGRLLVVGGVNGSTLLASAELYDPATGLWTATGSLTAPRQSHTATLLANGQVLVVGGQGSAGVIASAELYNPTSGTWSSTGSLTTARQQHTATLLPNGKILVAAGQGAAARLLSAELYDPALNSWSTIGSLTGVRAQATATLLPNGKVLITGGQGASSGPVGTAELYDPNGGTWSSTGSLADARQAHSATLLPNGKVIVVGGALVSGRLGSAELYDPVAETWTGTGSLITARYIHSASLLPNGKLLIVGGESSNVTTSSELYDPVSGAWSNTGSLVTAREFHTATVLPGGRVLVVAGRGPSNVSLASVEVFDPAAGTWSGTANMIGNRTGYAASIVPNGKVLVAGGFDGTNYVTSAELYDPVANFWSPTGSMAAAREYFSATLLANGKILVVGGLTSSTTALATAELYDPANGTWSTAGTMSATRYYHTATLLPNGKVLITGGQGVTPLSSPALTSAELYDPVSNSWATTGSLGAPRRNHTATLLPNGKVYAAGGVTGNSTYPANAELYDPANSIWTGAGSLPAFSDHTATLLPNGKVLLAGGNNGSPTNVAVLYDPVAATSAPTGAMMATRSKHNARLLPNGRVLVMAGQSAAGTATEIYDPATATWSASGAMGLSRFETLATLLANGKVLISGGFASGFTPTAELYDPGLAAAPASLPQIATATFDGSGRLVLTGTGFRGVSSASGGNGAQDSPTNHPLLLVRRLDNEQSVLVVPDISIGVSASGLTTGALPTLGQGHVSLIVYANGIPSAATVVPWTPTVASPGIALEQPLGSSLANGGSRSFAATTLTPGSLSFIVRNPGTANLTGLTLTKGGTNAADFTVTTPPVAPVLPGTNTTLVVRFAPSSSGTKTAALQIATNVPGSNPFIINLTGQLLSYATDMDSDGLNDAAEFDLAVLGFDWQLSQPALTTAYFAGAPGAGLYNQTQYTANFTAGQNSVTTSPNTFNLYTLTQIQDLNISTPLIQRNATTGIVKLTLGVQKSPNLATSSFVDFPMSGPGTTTTINAQGKLDFQFTVPDNAAFFRLHTP